MHLDRCEELSRLSQLVVDASDMVYAAACDLDEAKRTIANLIPYMAVLQAARAEEQRTVAALEKHQQQHGCSRIAGLSPAMSSDYEAIRANAQQALVGFLQAGLRAGMTVVQSALLVQSEGRTDHFIEAKRNAVRTAEPVKKFISRVKDQDTRTELQNQLSELERLISAL